VENEQELENRRSLPNSVDDRRADRGISHRREKKEKELIEKGALNSEPAIIERCQGSSPEMNRSSEADEEGRLSRCSKKGMRTPERPRLETKRGK